MPCATALCLAASIWLQQHSYDDSHRLAVLQHIHLESRFQPCVVSRSGSFLLQWAGSRLAWWRERYQGCPPWQAQLERMDYELRNVTVYSCFWHAQTESAALAALRRGFGRGRC